MSSDAPQLNLDIETFLNQYWQKKPLLIKNAFTDFSDPISPEELAGLACEEGIESRMVFKKQQTWQMKNGPFLEKDFTSLPEQDWTLLVQAVDPWFPSVKSLIDYFQFIPSWRIDDVLISYAEKNGGAGPHFDYYDVFIIQGKGSRTWKIGQHCNSQTELITDSGLNLLKEFEQQQEWQLNSGDMLYIPPGVAHYGIANNASLSYSIGFRAPSTSDMLISFSDEICADLNQDQRYKDINLQNDIHKSINKGEIKPDVIQEVERLLLKAINKPEAIKHWFGKFMTETRLPGIFDIPEIALSNIEFNQLLKNNPSFVKHPASRIAWSLENSLLSIFADGELFLFEKPQPAMLELNQLLNDTTTGQLPFNIARLDSSCLDLLCQLYNQGTIAVLE